MNYQRPPPEGKCCAKGCTNDAKYWYENSLFPHCGQIECVEKIHDEIEKFKDKANDYNETRDFDL